MNGRAVVVGVAALVAVLAVALVSQFSFRPSAQGPLVTASSPQVALAQGVPGPYSVPQNGIVVSGEGRINVQPDLAQITLGVEVTDPSAAGAQQAAANQMNSVADQLKKQGIAGKDIQTTRYDLVPEYDYSTKTAVLKDYKATNLVTVKVRDVSKVGPVLDAVAANGATRIQGISFSVSDPAAATTQGRDAAMKDAMAKADQLAKAVGVTVGAPVSIEETSATPPPAVDIAPRAAPAAGGVAAPTPISPGTQEVQVTVRVVFSIK